MSELDDARRIIQKDEDVLEKCLVYFAKQAEMNATAHMSDRVMYPPIHGAISSSLFGLKMHRETYPDA